jgi:hypothetical protein
VDRELAIALAGELPVTAGAAVPAPLCPAGSRAAAFRVPGGTVSAVVAPAGVAVPLSGGPEGAEVVRRTAESGRSLLVISIPAPGSHTAPHTRDVERIAAALASRF